MEFYSHPNKKLIDHLNEVYEISKDKIEVNYLDLYKIISFCHDFGKYTTYFQKYLFSGKRNKYSDHGFISALFAGYCSIKEYGERSILVLIAFNTVLHHHGNLENPSKDLPIDFRGISDRDYYLIDKINNTKIQIEDMKINKSEIANDYKLIGLDKYFNEFINTDIEDLLLKFKRIEAINDRNRKDENYFIHQILYSALISADKLSAAGIDIPKEMYANYNDLDNERRNILKGKDEGINKIRNEIFEKVQMNLANSYIKSRIFTITSPTGSGKTYAGVFASLRLRDLLQDNRRIIYSLPFTSIIEQNYDVLADLFNNIENYNKENSRYLIKHHSLANITYTSDIYDVDKLKAELLIENWNSGIVVTTFVQLLETLIGTRNRMLKKLINIKGSIILLDEIQAIDISLLPLVDYVLTKASELYDLRIIMMTATKPFILNNSIELLDNNEDYFKNFNRTKIIPRLDNITINHFLDEFKHNIEQKSYLIVCNTINQSLKIFNGLKEIDREVYYLSTNLLPIHRRERILEIKESLDRGENIILVSTQVIEAGVDLDFDVVIRDIGPIDSIVQASGRCNRNWANKIGEVYIYSLVDDVNFNLFGKHVYGNNTLIITKDILAEKDVIYEKDYFKIIAQYYKEIQNAKSRDESLNFINSIKSMNFSEEFSNNLPLKKFSLINNNTGYFDVFIIYDQTAQLVYEKYIEMIEEKDYKKSREIYLEIKNTIRDYTLSLPSKYHKIFTEEQGLFILPSYGVDDYYNKITGFEREEKSFDIF